METSKDGERWRFFGRVRKQPGEPVLLLLRMEDGTREELRPGDASLDGPLPPRAVRANRCTRCGSRSSVGPEVRPIPKSVADRAVRAAARCSGQSWTPMKERTSASLFTAWQQHWQTEVFRSAG